MADRVSRIIGGKPGQPFSISVTFTGERELQRKITKLENLGKIATIKRILGEAAVAGRNTAQGAAPVRLHGGGGGSLKRAIRYRITARSKGNVSASLYVENKPPVDRYAAAQELGTQKKNYTFKGNPLLVFDWYEGRTHSKFPQKIARKESKKKIARKKSKSPSVPNPEPVAFKSVKHPGLTGVGFLAKGLRQIERSFLLRLNREVRKI